MTLTLCCTNAFLVLIFDFVCCLPWIFHQKASVTTILKAYLIILLAVATVSVAAAIFYSLQRPILRSHVATRAVITHHVDTTVGQALDLVALSNAASNFERLGPAGLRVMPTHWNRATTTWISSCRTPKPASLFIVPQFGSQLRAHSSRCCR